MGSSFKGTDYFGSGPHRFTVGRQGRRVVSLSAVSGDVSVPGRIESGDWDLRVEVRGRLVATSEAALWTLRDALTAQGAFGVAPGTLRDPHGRSWDDMYLLYVEWGGPVSRGRTVSTGYAAYFGQLVT